MRHRLMIAPDSCSLPRTERAVVHDGRRQGRTSSRQTRSPWCEGDLDVVEQTALGDGKSSRRRMLVGMKGGGDDLIVVLVEEVIQRIVATLLHDAVELVRVDLTITIAVGLVNHVLWGRAKATIMRGVGQRG